MKYNKKIWISEEIITDEDLNALEEGLEDTNAEVENAKVKDDGTTYPTLKDRLNDIDSQIKSLGNLESGDLENLATKDYVDQAVSNVEVDLTDYPTKEEMQQAISNVEVDLTGYATEDYVNETVSEAVSNVEVDLTDYPTREEVQDAIWASEPDLSEYATLENLNSKTACKFDNVELNEAETNENQTALDFYSNGEVIKTVYFSGGGGGGSTILPPYISTTAPETTLVGIGEIFELPLDYSSSATGKGTLKISINDNDAINTSIPQGESVIEIEDKYFIKGENRISVYVTDRTGTMSNILTLYVRYGGLEIASDFDSHSAYEVGALIRYYFVPTVLDTSLALNMYMSIDGEVKDPVRCYNETRGYFTFPSNLSAGKHYCEAYIIDANDTKSNVLAFNLIILDEANIVIASDTKDVTIEEGYQIELDYKVYMNDRSNFTIKTYINDELINIGSCGLAINYYRNSTLLEGINIIKIEAYDATDETKMDYITWTITVTPSTYELLQPVTAGALFLGTAQNMTNSTEGKEVWTGTNEEGGLVIGMLHEFSFTNENGWSNDELVISGTSYVDIPVKPLANNAKYGFTLDIEFSSKMIGVEDAIVLDLWDEKKECGIKITTEELILQSADKNRCHLYFSDDETTSVIFIIDRNEGTAKIYLNGVMCSAFHLSDFEIDGVKYLEDFTVNKNIRIGGKGYCRVKNLRVYQLALSSDEILNNFMANEKNKAKQKELVEFQKGNTLPTLTVYCDFSGLGKDDKKPCAITYVSTDEEKYGKSFVISHKKSSTQYQGTSSMAYPIKNYRLNLADEKGKKWKYDFPYGKPQRRYTLKADFMSSGHWTNTGLTKWIDKYLYQYDEEDEKSMNPKKWYDLQNGGSIRDTRECIYGFPCRLILVNDGKTPLNEGQNEPTPGNTKDMGVFNFNHDKECEDTIGLDQEIFPNCASYEVTANSDTSAGAFMHYDNVDHGDMDELDYIKQSFELRFPDEEDVPSGWGFMGIPLEDFYIDYTGDSERNTTLLKIVDDRTYTIETSSGGDFMVSYYDGEKNLLGSSEEHIVSGETIIIPDKVDSVEVTNISIKTWSQDEYIIVNDEKWIFSEKIDDHIIVKSQYQKYEEGTGLSALLDWVDNSTDAQFVNEFEEHFNKAYTFRYFLLVMTLGMVDNLGKNMMIDTWDNKIFYPRFYDCDTICSYDNSGQLKFDVDIEMAQGYWNTSSSRLWTRVRDLFHDELVETYNTMRKNGMSYETFMECFYDEQIAKIPQKYYNMDFDVKYAPFADSYLGMANGDTYEHLKRWLKQRIRFVDTIYDYAPSYNNDMLTIRANTTELMTLEIETYTPVYQHLSWYNNQMDKKKIDGKTSVTFTGRAMAATDQEVLIYGGSNIKSIKGITSMNPNRMLIGSATKLVALEAPNCPLLADVNANKANFGPHIYLNKLDISNCPMLGGNLIVNNSTLLKEINIKGTAITGLNLPTNLRNLEILRLPAAIKAFILNDATQLHTLEFEDGVALESINMKNCYNLRNTVNFDIRTVSSLVLDNCFNEYEEFYFSNTNFISLSNMPNLRRLVLTPNAEYEVFDRENVNNAKNYKINTFNCDNLTEFVTTAPYRNSYNDCEVLGTKEVEKEKRVVVGKENKDIMPENKTSAMGWMDKGEFISDEGGITIVGLDYVKTTPNTVHTVQGCWCTIYYYDANKNYISSASATPTFTTPSFCEYVRYSTNTLEHPGYKNIKIIAPIDVIETVKVTVVLPEKVYPEKRPNQVFIANELDLSNTLIDSVKLLCTTDVNSLKLSKFTKELIIDSAYDLDEFYLLDGDYDNIHTELKQCYQSHFTDNVLLGDEVPNVVPSASDGSLIFAIHTAETELVQDKVWDFSGTDLENIQTFGLNNDIVQDENGNITMPHRIDGYDIITDNRFYRREVIRYTTDKLGILPTCNPEFSYTYELKYLEGNKYQYSIIADSLSNMPTYVRFENELNLLSVDHAKTDSLTTMYRMFYGCKNLTSVATEDWNVSNVTNMDAVFSGCANLTSLNLSSWNTSKVTTMNSMFSSCSKLNELLLDKDKWNTSNVTNIAGLFNGCSKLEYVDLSIFDTSNVTSLSYTFSACGFPQSVYEGLKDWDVRKVYTIEGMFRNNSKLTSLEPFRNWKTDSLMLTMLCWQGCNFTTIEPLKNWNWSKVTALVYFFHYCLKLTDLTGIDQWNIASFGDLGDMLAYFNGEVIDLSSWGPVSANLRSLSGTMAYCPNLKTANLSGWKPKNAVNLYRLFFYTTKLERFVLDDASIPVSSIEDMFLGCNFLTEFDPTKIITTNCTKMNRAFYGCYAITSMDLSSWDLGKCTTVSQIFHACKELTSVKFNQGANAITNAENMFSQCPKLTYLEPPMLDKVTTATLDFSSCPLDAGSAVRIMNNLGTSTTSQVLKFSATTLASLTEDQIAIAANKGWTVQ